MKALAFKELREVLGITAVALGGYLALVLSLMGAKVFDWVPGMPHGTREVPFTGDGFILFFGFVSIVFTIALGFRQSIVESCRGTYLFLLHRPMAWETIFLTKVLLGLGVFFLCASLPILLYGIWASMPGHHPSPFEWSMTRPAWDFTWLLSLLYLGAFLSGLRRARWVGTRLLPLIAAIFLLIIQSNLPWSSLRLLLTLVLDGLFVTAICFVARVRDYA
jgi:hypothetical protein